MSRRPACPISLYVAGRTVVVAGDGAGADERAHRMRTAGATVVRMARADYRAEALAGAFVVIAHDGDDQFNVEVAAAARAAGALAYAHDRPDLSDFAMPALVRRGPLTIAIATDNAAPALARRLREELTRLLDGAGDALDRLVEHLERRRGALPRGQRAELYRIARGLRFTGTLAVDRDLRGLDDPS
jgi:precorrin-2 dehydrogenase / sirohydrochlorin ferrochelatase